MSEKKVIYRKISMEEMIKTLLTLTDGNRPASPEGKR